MKTKKIKSFTTIELVVTILLFSVILSSTALVFNKSKFYRYEVESIILQIESEITKLKFVAMDQNTTASMVLDGRGNIIFTCNNKSKVLSFGKYKVFTTNYDYDVFDFTKTFKFINRRYGNNGFTIYIFHGDNALGKIVFFVGTCNFRYEVF